MIFPFLLWNSYFWQILALKIRVFCCFWLLARVGSCRYCRGASQEGKLCSLQNVALCVVPPASCDVPPAFPPTSLVAYSCVQFCTFLIFTSERSHKSFIFWVGVIHISNETELNIYHIAELQHPQQPLYSALAGIEICLSDCWQKHTLIRENPTENSNSGVWKSWPGKKTHSGVATVEGKEHCLQTCKRLLPKIKIIYSVLLGWIGDV